MISCDVLMSADTVVNLGGDEAAAELMASLWAVDCQSCGRPLGRKPPAAELTAATARVTVRTLPDGVYESDLDAEVGPPDQFRAQITSQGGIMLAVSHLSTQMTAAPWPGSSPARCARAACCAAGSR